MLKEQTSNEEYIKFVDTWLHAVYPQGPPPIHAHVATMLMLVDLTPLRKIIEHLYSAFGRPASLCFAWCCADTLPSLSGLPK